MTEKRFCTDQPLTSKARGIARLNAKTGFPDTSIAVLHVYLAPPIYYSCVSRLKVLLSILLLTHFGKNVFSSRYFSKVFRDTVEVPFN